MKEWIEIEAAEDVQTSEEVLLWDGCDYFIDYVECCPETYNKYFANNTKGITHYKLLTPPIGESK